MKIIKQGKLPKLKKFECHKCHTVFACTREECEHLDPLFKALNNAYSDYFARCPFCKATVSDWAFGEPYTEEE